MQFYDLKSFTLQVDLTDLDTDSYFFFIFQLLPYHGCLLLSEEANIDILMSAAIWDDVFCSKISTCIGFMCQGSFLLIYHLSQD